METPYDEVYDVKHDTSRKERSSTFMAAIHGIPKKIADTAQTQGVSEKFLTNGIPSGVINPSMMAHDRYLSVMDAIQDSIILALIILIVPFLPMNTFFITILIIVCAYWVFHIAWWEKTKIWGTKASAKRYLKNTYVFYWVVLLLLLTPIAFGMWYFIIKLGIQSFSFGIINSILSVIAGSEKAIADVFGNIEFIKNNLDINANYFISISNDDYEGIFIIASSVFFILTIGSKLFFGFLYKSEQKENLEFSEDAMRYKGESALEIIKKSRDV